MSENRKALIILNMQMDFCRGGTLAIEGAGSLVPMITRYMEGFIKAGGDIYAVRELNPEETSHFKASGGKWPPHCVKGSPGAEFHPNLKLPPETTIITRGLDPKEDSCSAFDGFDEEGRSLIDSLLANNVNHIYLAGLATEYGVRATALEGRSLGFAVTVLIDAVKPVNEKIGDSEVAIGEMRSAGAQTRDFSCLVIALSRSMQKVRT